MDYITLIGYIVGAPSIIVAAIYYLRFIATKANIDGKNETINTLTKSNEAYSDENERITKENNELKGQVQALQQIVTNTPEIIKLTRSVTVLTESVARQHKETSAQNQGITVLLTELVNIMKDERTGKKHAKSSTTRGGDSRA